MSTMANNEVADETMDSLLKEIDEEMENTISSENKSSPRADGKESRPKRSWSIPLQEIGDETMEMIVSHNTINNIMLRNEEAVKNGVEPLVSNRKSVVFSEGVNLHEYENVSDDEDEKEDVDDDSARLVTSWKRSSFLEAQPASVDQSLVVEAHSDSENEDHDREQDVITTQELLQHTVTDLDQKLSHMLDKKSNVQRLKLMTEEMEENEENEQKKQDDSNTINFTLQPTKPLIPSTGNSIEETSLIHFQSVENLAERSDDDDDNDSCAEYMNEVLHSPSKIPLVNTVNINKFSIPNQSGEPQTRMSSGSSCCDSMADLKTTIQHDSYKLLSNKSYETTAHNGSMISLDDKPLEREDVVTNHPNSSRIFSVATSGEGYRSAKESVQGLESTFTSEDMKELSSNKPLEIPSEDLDITATLMDGDDTSREEDEGPHEFGDDEPDSGSVVERALGVEEYQPEIPQLPPLAPAQSILSSKDSMGKRTEPEHEDIDLFEVKFTDLHDVEPMEKEAEQEASAKDEIITEKANMVDVDQETVNEAPQLDVNKAISVEESTAAVSDSAATESGSSQNKVDAEDSLRGHQEKERKASGSRHFSILPPFAPTESMFLDDPFVDAFETSGESIDLTKSVKPSDYLSIWHMQEEDIRTNSPAISSNSQFSRCTDSTNTSASVNSGVEHNFKFKPRVISRSKYYYPDSRHPSSDLADNYVIPTFETALDPLRRNTIISKKIQENIKNRRICPPKVGISENESESVCSGNIAHAEKTANNNYGVDAEEPATADAEKQSTEDFQLNLLPCLPDAELKEEFMTYLEAVGHDTGSILNTSDNEKGKYNIWDQQSDFNGKEAKNKVSIEVIHQLLNQENQKSLSEEEEAAISQPASNLAILKTPVKDVSVGRGLSLKGFDVTVSNEIDVGRDTGSLAGFSEDEDDELRQSPLKKTHVGSPFKVKSRKQTPHNSDESKLQGLAIKSMDPIENLTVGSLQSVPAEYLNKEDKQSQSAEEEDEKLPDRGNLYIKLENVSEIALQGIKHHRAEFAIEFDNGTDVVQTSWESLGNERKWDIGKEFEIILDNDLNKMGKLVITLKCRYESPKSEIKEVVEKVLVGKKFPFGKNKYAYEKRFVQRAPERDDWDYLFARDGSFGRCEISINEAFLHDIKFQNKSLSFALINEWARKYEPGSPKRLHELPRRPAYTVGKLRLEACHLERTSPLEKFPKTLAIAHNIVSEYRKQQSISKEGFLLQEGGDIQGGIQRRFFKLQGSNMLGYHERTRQPKIDINLLKVIDIFGPGDIPKEGERNLTDLVLFSGCFHLIFDNGEKIAFSSEAADEETDWCEKIKTVIDLNRCHQPWVKYLNHNSLI